MDTLAMDAFVFVVYLILMGVVTLAAFVIIFLWRILDYAFDISGRWNRFAGQMSEWL